MLEAFILITKNDQVIEDITIFFQLYPVCIVIRHCSKLIVKNVQYQRIKLMTIERTHNELYLLRVICFNMDHLFFPILMFSNQKQYKTQSSRSEFPRFVLKQVYEVNIQSSRDTRAWKSVVLVYLLVNFFPSRMQCATALIHIVDHLIIVDIDVTT